MTSRLRLGTAVLLTGLRSPSHLAKALRWRHLLLNPVFDELEHPERLASDVVPKL
ncbi:MAG: hypothetical protein HY216_12965 [Candidatus Rokubacteria bacterium]|nr:hypothetical protein [Candidatus Rokubacteria bacterium]